jgi:protein involved in ribonucleotide reduction
MIDIVYFSNVTETTKRFADKIVLPQDSQKHRIPIKGEHVAPLPNPYILIVPTYGDSHGKRHIPHQVIKFLNQPNLRANCIGVIGAGNRNFGKEYAKAGTLIAQKLNVPLYYRIEISGDAEDVINVETIIIQLEKEKPWTSSNTSQTPHSLATTNLSTPQLVTA